MPITSRIGLWCWKNSDGYMKIIIIILAILAAAFAYKGVIDARHNMLEFAKQERERVSRETVKMNFGTPSEILEGKMK